MYCKYIKFIEIFYFNLTKKIIISLHGEHVTDRQIDIIVVLSKELLVLFEIEEAHIHELEKSCFGSVRKV